MRFQFKRDGGHLQPHPPYSGPAHRSGRSLPVSTCPRCSRGALQGPGAVPTHARESPLPVHHEASGHCVQVHSSINRWREGWGGGRGGEEDGGGEGDVEGGGEGVEQ